MSSPGDRVTRWRWLLPTNRLGPADYDILGRRPWDGRSSATLHSARATPASPGPLGKGTGGPKGRRGSAFDDPAPLAEEAGGGQAHRHGADDEAAHGAGLDSGWNVALVQQDDGLKRVDAGRHDDDARHRERNARIAQRGARQRGEQPDRERAEEGGWRQGHAEIVQHQ